MCSKPERSLDAAAASPLMNLSPFQEHAWSLATQCGWRFSCQGAWYINADPGSVLSAARAAVARHEALRTVVFRDDASGQAAQLVADPGSAVVRLVPGGSIRDVIHQDADELERGADQAVCRITVLPADGGASILVITADSLVADEEALSFVVRQIDDEATTGLAPGEPATQLADLAARQADWFDDEDHAADREAWRRRRQALPDCWLVEPALPKHTGKRRLRLGAATARQLGRTAAELGCDRADIVAVALALVSGRMTGADRVVVTVGMSGRDTEELRGVVAPLSPMLPVAIPVTGGATMRDTIVAYASERRSALAISAHADPRILFGGRAGKAMLPQLYVQASAEAGDGPAELRAPQLVRAMTSLRVEADALAVSVIGSDTEAGLTTAYVEYVVTDFLDHPGRALDDMALTEPSDPPASRLVGPRRLVPSHTLDALVRAQAMRRPTQRAVQDGEVELTYADLDARVAALARQLRAAGVGPNSAVPVIGARPWQMLVSMLAVWEVGAAYTPIDTASPTARCALQLEDVFVRRGSRVAIVGSAEHMNLMTDPAITVMVGVDADHGDHAETASADRVGVALPNAPAYIHYPTGAAGRPAGVVVPHHALSNYLAWAADFYGAATGSLVYVPPALDLTVTSLLGPLIVGGTVRIVPAGDGMAGLISALRGEGGTERIGIVKLTPAQLRTLTQVLRPEALQARVDVLIVGGGALDVQLARRVRSLFGGSRIVHEYGPTEIVVGCTVHELDGSEISDVPIGRPIANTIVAIMRGDRVAPQCTVGEIVISGQGVADGYLNRPELTEARFVSNELGTSARLRCYRTGDAGRVDGDGILRFLGRMDNQVRGRGCRVEPRDVEATLRQPTVSDAAAVAGP